MNLSNLVRTDDVVAATSLLGSGAPVDGRDPDGSTPLILAAASGRVEMARLLIAAGADLLAVEPRMGATSLHKAAQSGSANVVELLLESGSLIDQQTPTLGNTALIDAVLYNSGAVVEVLLRRGAKTFLRNHFQQTALDVARDDDLHDIARLIADCDAARTSLVAEQRLIAAARHGDLATVEHLIAEGADLEARSPMVGTMDDDYTALGLASREGHVGVVRRLLDAGADPRPANGLMGGTPLHEAAFMGHAEVIHALLAHNEPQGATLEVLDVRGAYNGFTALHDAVWHGHLDAARALIAAGARTDLASHTGTTPRALAERYGYEDIVEATLHPETVQPLRAARPS